MRRSPLERVPKAHEKQLYRDRPEWHRYQRFYPEHMRLNSNNLPQETWWDWQGHPIHLDRYAAADNPSHGSSHGTMILLHGGGGNGRVLSPLALMARSLGLDVVAPDMPGYGLTVRSPDLKPSYALWTRIAADLVRAERTHSDAPVFLWGLSLGGLLAYAVAAELAVAAEPVAGVIATTLADTRQPATMAAVGRNQFLGYGGYASIKLLGSLLNPIRMPIKWLSKMFWIANYPALSRVFMADQLAGGAMVTMEFLASLVNVPLAQEPEAFTASPLLLAHPALDPWTPLELSLPFFDRLACPKKLVMLEGCGHLPIETPGVEQMRDAVAQFVATA
jgi:alpha-beta hydrolase superfamily lysophospholipase